MSEPAPSHDAATPKLHPNVEVAGRATIEDVAAAASVSVATVSRALRGLPNVAAGTRARVEAVALDLDYRPDPAAARLAAGRTSTVTIAVPALNGWYFSNVVAGAEAICADAGLEFQVIGVSTPTDRDRLFEERHRLERRTDALILVDIHITQDQAASLSRRGVALATIGCGVSTHPGVRIDDTHVGALAGAHLVELGHERMGVIGGLPSDPMNPDVAILRERGFRAVLNQHDIELPSDRVISGAFSITGGYESMTELMAMPTPPTAVFALSDEMAFGALMAINEAGLVPGVDCSIMGVDDHEFARVVQLTTVRQPVSDHGAAAARMVVEEMTSRSEHRDPPPVVTEQPAIELVARATTGPAT